MPDDERRPGGEPQSEADLAGMVRLAALIVAKGHEPPMPVGALVMALARTVVHLAGK